MPSMHACRCLVCDRDLVNRETDGSSSGAGGTPAANCLPSPAVPRLDSFAATATTGCSSPLGPGLNAAELRKLAEDRLLHGSSALW